MISAYTFGLILGSLFMGAILGAIPLILGKARKKKKLAIGGFVACIAGSFLAGLFLSAPLCILFVILILAIKNKPPDTEPDIEPDIEPVENNRGETGDQNKMDSQNKFSKNMCAIISLCAGVISIITYVPVLMAAESAFARVSSVLMCLAFGFGVTAFSRKENRFMAVAGILMALVGFALRLFAVI